MSALELVTRVLGDADQALTVYLDEGGELVFGEADQARDLRIYTNLQTLEDLVRGRFDPRRPAPDHLFLWSGETAALEVLTRKLRRGGDWLAIQGEGAP